jgi:uncharacterized membrane protein
MTPRHSRIAVFRSPLLTAAAAAVWCLQIWLLLTERQLSSQLWPDDIQATVVSLLGGSVTPSVIGGRRYSLPYTSVYLRTMIVIGLCAAAAWLKQRLTTRRTAKNHSQQHSAPRTAALVPAATFSAVWLMLWFIAPLLSMVSLDQFLTATAPASLGISIALATVGCCVLLDVSPTTRSSASHENSSHLSWLDRTAPLALVLAAIVWQCTSFWMNYQLYEGLLVPHGDSAMYEEHLWNLWHGKGFRSYLDQGLFLGEHIQVIHLLLLPLHIVWPHYLLLEWFASACLAASVWPIYCITLRHTGCRRTGLLMGLAWLFYTPMHFLDIAIDLKTLRPSCYGVFALLLFIDQAERGNRLRALLCCLLALMTQEDFALITGGISCVLWVLERNRGNPNERRRQQQLAASLAVASAAWVLLAVLVVIPAFRGGEVVHYSRYFGDLGRSPSELLRTAITEPGRVFAVLCSSRTLLYLLMLTGPLGFVCWKSPLRLTAGLATFTMLSLIQLGNDGPGSTATELPPVPFHHFHAPLVPVLFWAAAAGLSHRPWPAGRTSSLRTVLQYPVSPVTQAPRHAARFACLCAAATALTGSLMPCGTAFWSGESPFGWRNLYVPGARAREFPKVLARIPTSARVASTDFVHTRLTHFERSWDYSDYPRAVNNYQPGVPLDTDFIVIDTTHPYSTVRSPAEVRELREHPERWELLPDDTGGLFLILRRRTETP